MTRSRGRPRIEPDAQSVYEFSQDCLRILENFRDDDWKKLVRLDDAESVAKYLPTLPFGYKLIGGLPPNNPKSLTALIAKAIRERDFPQYSTKAQKRFVAHSLAAEGRVSTRRSRQICAKFKGADAEA